MFTMSVECKGELSVREMTSAVNSVLRITATVLVFVFHCNALYGLGSDRPLFYAFSFFLFLSGFYAASARSNPVGWLMRRLRRIYIPYWIVVVGVVAANMMYGYKDVGVFEIGVLLAGGNLFIDNSLYVIAWFVSAILCFYLYVFVIAVLRSVALRVGVTVVWAWFLLVFDIPPYFFVAFALGFLLRRLMASTGVDKESFRSGGAFHASLSTSSGLLFTVQNYSYEFFLLHGGVLILFTKVFHAGYAVSFLAGFLLTAAGAVLLKRLSNRIDELVVSLTS